MSGEGFDRAKLRLRPLGDRRHDMALADVLEVNAETPAFDHPDLPKLAQRIAEARKHQRQVIVVMGAHVIKQGLSRFLIDLMRRGAITCLGMNGACVIHDFELALVGATTESVARYIRTGEFGLWEETGQINDIVNAAGSEKGFGEAVGEVIVTQGLRHRDISLLATGHTLGVPVTVHVGIGYDIIHVHPNFDGAAAGARSYRDFLTFAEHVRKLEGGVLLCLGSAVMGPEVFQKALSMARNVEHQEGREIRHFTTAVFDLLDLGGAIDAEPPKTDPRYYFRPWKTVLVRTVADGGESFYFQGDMRASVPALRRAVIERLDG
jgi:hypothetical protein